MDLSFIANAIGEIAFAYAMVKVVPYIAATVLVAMDKMPAEKVEGLFKKTEKRKF